MLICRLAPGQQDMFWECGCWAWDVTASWCILNEAGGVIVDGHPDD
jgi:myo-inositol-1(or 4)-monophosphatase